MTSEKMVFDLQKKIKDSEQRIAELSMSFDLCSAMVTARNEEEIIKRILELFSLLTSPSRLAYFPIINNQYEPVHKMSGDLKEYSPPKVSVVDLPPLHMQSPDSPDSLLTIRYCKEPMGVLCFGEFLLSDHQSHYLSLAHTILPVCSLAIHNARTFDTLNLVAQNLENEIIQKKQVENALRKTNQHLNFMTSITRHDVLNKIQAIQIFTKIMKSKTEMSQIAEPLTLIKSAADIIQSQIEFTRLYQDLGSQDPSWQQIKPILLRQYTPDDVLYLVDIEEIEIFADPLFERVFYNLLDNSIRHGKNVTRINISSQEVTEGLSLSWEDDGVGIPFSEKDEIFKRGYGKNTGLGLFFIREILSITGMTITETGEEGKGARFEILIPKGGYRITNTVSHTEKEKS